jgi:hypothetical protein
MVLECLGCDEMKNPWLDLPLSLPYLLPSDREIILDGNKRFKEFHEIRHNVLPEPYLGNPEAPVILLTLNPGYADEDISFYEQKHALELWRKNILHEPMDYPFWMINPILDPKLGGTKWWLRRLKEPIKLVGLERVANRVCCIEFFPYHSYEFSPLKTKLESQKYSFHLVQKAIQRKAVIILMRSKRIWVEAVPQLKDHKFLFGLNSVQNITISRNNCPQGFTYIEQALI